MYAFSLVFLVACPPADRVPERVEEPDAGGLAAEADPASGEAAAELAEAQQIEQHAAGEVADARARLDAAHADVSAAEGEIRAAEANRDEDRLRDARALLARRKVQEAEAGALVRWKELERAAAADAVTAAEAKRDVRRAEHELRRLDDALLRGEGAGYTRSAFLEQLADNQRRWEQAREEARLSRVEAEEAREAWMRAREESTSAP